MRWYVIGAIVLVLLLGGAGYYYAYVQNAPSGGGVACTLEAKLCPDGSYVGRVPPSCNFSPCPGATSTPTTGAPVVGAGEHCGGFIRNAPVCAAGLRCALNTSRPDTGGTCVADNSGGTSQKTGVSGIVMLGPTCPVEQNPPQPGCADKPYATMVVLFRATDPVHAYAISRSASDGTFSFSAPPGSYTLGAGESNLPRCNHPNVTVPAAGYATTTISCDTGIR